MIYALFLVGFAAIVAGCWLISEPLALIVAGVLLIAVAIGAARAQAREGDA